MVRRSHARFHAQFRLHRARHSDCLHGRSGGEGSRARQAIADGRPVSLRAVHRMRRPRITTQRTRARKRAQPRRHWESHLTSWRFSSARRDKGWPRKQAAQNHKVYAAWKAAGDPNLDLLNVLLAAKLVGAERIDKGQVTLAEYQLQLEATKPFQCRFAIKGDGGFRRDTSCAGSICSRAVAGTRRASIG